jgi:hypothetical protein
MVRDGTNDDRKDSPGCDHPAVDHYVRGDRTRAGHGNRGHCRLGVGRPGFRRNVDMGMVFMTEKLDQQTLENVVRELTALGDAWGESTSPGGHPIYCLCNGIPAGATMGIVRARNARITMVLITIMKHTGQLVTDDVIYQIMGFVDGTADDDDFND